MKNLKRPYWWGSALQEDFCKSLLASALVLTHSVPLAAVNGDQQLLQELQSCSASRLPLVALTDA